MKLRDTRTGLEHEVRFDASTGEAWIDGTTARRMRPEEGDPGDVILGYTIKEGGNRLFHLSLADLRGLPGE